MTSTHYVATVTVERVDHIDTTKRTGGALMNTTEQGTKRIVTSLASFTVRDDGLASLVTTVSQHLALVNDIDAIDPKKGITR